MNEINNAVNFCADLIGMGMNKQEAVTESYKNVKGLLLKSVFINMVQIVMINNYLETQKKCGK